jgi:hypothetical protein
VSVKKDRANPGTIISVDSGNGKPMQVGRVFEWSDRPNAEVTIEEVKIKASAVGGGVTGNVRQYPSHIFEDFCNKPEYQKEVLKTIEGISDEDLPLHLNDEDPIIRKMVGLRLASREKVWK